MFGYGEELFNGVGRVVVDVGKGPDPQRKGKKERGGRGKGRKKKGGEKREGGGGKEGEKEEKQGWEESIAVQGSIGGFDYRING
ncbi:hypothetical protein, partial [Escherichia coli]|uniref:hypothetical protein n=1 Tax=Escherichia coli TaxID=562 RepID=UPI0010CC5086